MNTDDTFGTAGETRTQGGRPLEESSDRATSESSDHVPTDRLHFAYARAEPNLDAFDVKRVVPTRLLGVPAVLTIIGESHYVGVPALDFHEVCSCKPLDGDSTAVTPLDGGVEREFAFENDHLRAETTAEVRPIAAFPGPDGADAAYRFDPEAWTTIEVGADESPRKAAYETYHTYPEYALAVYTATTVRRTADAETRTTDD